MRPPVILVALLPLGGLVDIRDVLDPLPHNDREAVWMVSSRIDTTPRSGWYIDPITQLVHDYDASTETLTPTGEASSLVLYAQIDVYPKGESPDVATPSRAIAPQERTCGNEFCVRAIVLVTGKHSVVVEIEAIPDSCRPSKDRFETPPQPLGGVTFYEADHHVDYCGPGTAKAALFVDEIMVDRDQSRYASFRGE